jgi:hypothetical protein
LPGVVAKEKGSSAAQKAANTIVVMKIANAHRADIRRQSFKQLAASIFGKCGLSVSYVPSENAAGMCGCSKKSIAHRNVGMLLGWLAARPIRLFLFFADFLCHLLSPFAAHKPHIEPHIEPRIAAYFRLLPHIREFIYLFRKAYCGSFFLEIRFLCCPKTCRN